MNKYESRINELKLTETKQRELRGSKAKKRHNESQKKTDRLEYNKTAEKHNFDLIPEPLEEKMPKLQLKDLIESTRPKRVHEKVKPPVRSPTLETVVADQRKMAERYLANDSTQ